jgi:hypothetical protein
VEWLIRDIDTASGSVHHSSTAIIDIVVTNYTGPDHTNKETLLQVDASVPVYSAPSSAKVIQSWKHFDNVYTIPPFGKDGAVNWAGRRAIIERNIAGLCTILAARMERGLSRSPFWSHGYMGKRRRERWRGRMSRVNSSWSLRR